MHIAGPRGAGPREDVAEQHIADLVARTCQEYRDAGAAYGDEIEGFLRWLNERGSSVVV
jgi:hypothetical protein